MQVSEDAINRLIAKIDEGGKASSAPLRLSDTEGKLGDMDQDLVDAKMAAAEARVDTEFAKLRGELQRLPGKATVWGAAGSLFLGVLAILSFGGDRLALGLGQADARQAQLQRDAAQDATAKETSAKLDEILKRIPVTDNGSAATKP